MTTGWRRTALLTALLAGACGGEAGGRGELDDGSSAPTKTDSAGGEPAVDSVARPGGDGGEVAQGAADPASPDASGSTGGPAAPFEGTVGPTERGGRVAGVATQTAVRAARQTGYDRVVFEFANAAIPPYRIEYVDRPITQCGSGQTVAIAGDAWLRIRLSPARAHDDAGNATVTQRAFSPDLPVLREARLTCDFEAELEWVLGLTEPNRYRVLELSNPPRLVVDVLH